jgi:hypothetical protein
VSKTQTQRAVDVFVVDTPRAVGTALGVPSADAESTHVLCRHTDETTPDFSTRVLKRIQRIQQNQRVRALCYVVGAESGMTRPGHVLSALLPVLDEGSSLTVVGPRSHQSAVFACIDSAMQRGRDDLTLRAELYAEPEQATPRPVRPQPSTPAPVAMARSRALAAAHRDGWFPREPKGALPASDIGLH